MGLGARKSKSGEHRLSLLCHSFLLLSLFLYLPL